MVTGEDLNNLIIAYKHYFKLTFLFEGLDNSINYIILIIYGFLNSFHRVINNIYFSYSQQNTTL